MMLRKCLASGWLYRAIEACRGVQTPGGRAGKGFRAGAFFNHPNLSIHLSSIRKVQGHPLHNHGANHAEHIRAERRGLDEGPPGQR